MPEERIALKIEFPEAKFGNLDAAQQRLKQFQLQIQSTSAALDKMLLMGGGGVRNLGGLKQVVASIDAAAAATAKATAATKAAIVEEGKLVKIRQDLIKGNTTRTTSIGTGTSQSLTKQAASLRSGGAGSDFERGTASGRNFLSNLEHVTQWAASIGVLYGSLRLAKEGMEALINTSFQEARLTQIFKGQAGEARELTYAVMGLAAANGRSTQEAMESAIQWARLGLNRIQVQEAVKVSLMAANSAQITAAESTEHLSSLMMIYGLRASELNGVLGMLVNTSNTFNVSTNDLLQGLTRAAAIAKQAGISFEELQGFIAAGVGSTGQTGNMIGNAVKSALGSLTDDRTRTMLREVFQFNVGGGQARFGKGGKEMVGDLTDMSKVVQDLYVKYQSMEQAERQTMLFSSFGKQQASRMAAILDNYVTAEVKAITATLNLGAAERENQLILDSTKARLQGLISEFQKFAYVQANVGSGLGAKKEGEIGGSGPSLAGFTNNTLTLMRNGLRMLNTEAGSGVFTVLAIVLGAVAARLVLTSMAMSAVGNKNAFLANTFTALRNALNGVAVSMGGTLQRGSYMVGMLKGLAGGSITAASAARALGTAWLFTKGIMASAAIAAADILLPLAAFYGVMKGINALAEKAGYSHDQLDERLMASDANIQVAEKAIESAQIQTRLIQTVRQVFTSGGSTEEQRLGIAEQLRPGLFPESSSDTEAEKQRKFEERGRAMGKLNLIAKTTDAAQRDAAMEQFQIQQAISIQEQESIARKEKLLQITRQEIEITKQLQHPGVLATEKQKLELEQKLRTLHQDRTKTYSEESDSERNRYEEWRKNSMEFNRWLNEQHGVAGQFTGMYSELPGHGRQVGSLQDTFASQQDIADYYRSQKEMHSQAIQQANKEMSEELKPLIGEQSQLNLMRDSVINTQINNPSAINMPRGTPGWLQSLMQGTQWAGNRVLPSGWTSVGSPFESQMTAIEAQQESLRARRKNIEGRFQTEDYKFHQGAIPVSAEMEKEARQKASEAGGAISLAMLRERRGVAGMFGRAEADSFAIGLTPGEQAANQVAGLRKAIGDKEGQIGRDLGTGRTDAADSHRVQLLEMELAVYQKIESSAVKLIELKKEETNLQLRLNNEYNRNIMMAGPGEMLKRLMVMKQMQGGHMSMANFMAMDPEGKKYAGELPEFSREMTMLHRSMSGFARVPDGGSMEAVQKANAAYNVARGKIVSGMQRDFPVDNDALSRAVSVASTTVNAFATAVEDATVRIANAVRGNLGGPPPNPNNPATATPSIPAAVNSQSPAPVGQSGPGFGRSAANFIFGPKGASMLFD